MSVDAIRCHSLYSSSTHSDLAILWKGEVEVDYLDSRRMLDIFAYGRTFNDDNSGRRRYKLPAINATATLITLFSCYLRLSSNTVLNSLPKPQLCQHLVPFCGQDVYFVLKV
ncbi:hypothetical protein HL42_2720 [Trichophyton rubrum]|nr:hypothetical protein HL42_2720 [Trichophyton rubrum]